MLPPPRGLLPLLLLLHSFLPVATLSQIFPTSIHFQLRLFFDLHAPLGRHLASPSFPYPGPTVLRHTFETQLLLDLAAHAAPPLNISHLVVLRIEDEEEARRKNTPAILATLRLLHDAVLPTTTIQAWTRHAENRSSTWYDERTSPVLYAADRRFGLRVLEWDVGLTLRYSLAAVVGREEEVWRDPCDDGGGKGETVACDFAGYYLNDLANALGFSPSNLQLLSVVQSPDSSEAVLLHTRLYPSPALNTTAARLSLVEQALNFTSPLYKQGNVTLRLDPVAGIWLSQDGHWRQIAKQARTTALSPFVAHAALPTPIDAYERCQGTHLCPSPMDTGLFLDFEDWRQGTRATFSSMPAADPLAPLPGAHVSPFLYPPLRLVPEMWVEGMYTPHDLVLDRATVQRQQALCHATIAKQQEQLAFWQQHADTALLNNSLGLRTRHQVRQRVVEETIQPLEALLAREEEKRHNLSTMVPCALPFSSCSVVFNTSAVALHVLENDTVVASAMGALDWTRLHGGDTHEMAVFVFDALFLGPTVNVTVVGQRPLVLVSRSSLVVNTSLLVPPGTCGGFPGGYGVARRGGDRLSDAPLDVGMHDLACSTHLSPSNNINGPGSSSVRVYRFTLQLRPTMVQNEVQVVETSARPGQTLQGRFALELGGVRTPLLPHDVTSADLQGALAQLWGRHVEVMRGARSPEGGYRWTVTFVLGTSAPPPLLVAAHDGLQGDGARTDIARLQPGLPITGGFVLSFLGGLTRPIPHDTSPKALRAILVEDISAVQDATVLYAHDTWTLILTTQQGNVSPLSPASELAWREGPVDELRVHASGLGRAEVLVHPGHASSPDDNARRLDALVAPHTGPFSLAYGGRGGRRRTSAHLVGGSGGALGGVDVLAIGQVAAPQGRGGAGGGALELVAVHDIVLGSSAHLVVDGQDGHSGNVWGGGGGAGGSVVLVAAGVLDVDQHARLSARGGRGGDADADDGGTAGEAGDAGVVVLVRGGSGDFAAVEGQAALGTRRALYVEQGEAVYDLPRARSLQVTRLTSWVRLASAQANASLVLQFSGATVAASLALFFDATTLSLGSWHKVDAVLDWQRQSYHLRLDDVLHLHDEPFNASPTRTVDRLVLRGHHAYFDEVFAGQDTTQGFVCPFAPPGPPRPNNHYHVEPNARRTRPMTRWPSHVSRRYLSSDVAIPPYDGPETEAFVQEDDGDGVSGGLEEEPMRLADGLLVVGDPRQSAPLRHYWYGQHAQGQGIAVCSTEDFQTWRFEGTALLRPDGANVADAVEQPRVVYCAATRQYVMWLQLRHQNQTGIAVSDVASGPFALVRVLQPAPPDDARTHDLVVHVGRAGQGYVAWTFYRSVPYVLPQAAVQPTWESVAVQDFRLNYQRAVYTPGYDDPHDIAAQRRRREDVPFQVLCVNRISGINRTLPDVSSLLVAPALTSWCLLPLEYKVVVGAGVGRLALSQYLDSSRAEFNDWLPSSAPSVQAQPWGANVRDALCNVLGEGRCDAQTTAAADNPVHATVPDARVGEAETVLTRRQKYVGLARLTEDYLDTTGSVKVVEHALAGTARLRSAVVAELVGGGWEPEEEQEERQPQKEDLATLGDWRRRFHQYENVHNDRASYALACVVDGEC